MVHTTSQLFASLRKDRHMFQYHAVCVKHRAVSFWMTFRTFFKCFPLSHTKSLSMSYHQECRLNPGLFTRLDGGKRFGVPFFVYTTSKLVPSIVGSQTANSTADSFEVHLDVDLKTRIEVGDSYTDDVCAVSTLLKCYMKP